MHGVHVYKGRPQSAFVLLSVRDMMNEMRLVHETTDDSESETAAAAATLHHIIIIITGQLTPVFWSGI